jgi:hypothetical protein
MPQVDENCAWGVATCGDIDILWQGDQIGRIFADRAIIFLGQLL